MNKDHWGTGAHEDHERLKNSKDNLVTFVKRYQFMKEKSFGLMLYWGNYNFPLELTFVFPFFSLWITFGQQKER